MLESLCLDRGSGSIVIVYEGGATQELRRCPFSECHLYHSTLLVDICPATGKSIVEEIGRQKREEEREARASRAEAEYRDKHIKGFRYQWRGWLGVWGAIALFAVMMFFAPETMSASTIVLLALSWAAGWILWQSAINNRIEDEAREIGASVLKGGDMNPNTIAATLRRSSWP